MEKIDTIIPTLTTILGLAITTLIVIRQITLQRRRNYLTSMLKDIDIMNWYKIFLKDLRFLYETLEVFPNLTINAETINFAQKSEEKSQKLEYITTYIRHVLRDDERLKSKFSKLANLTNVEYNSQNIFTVENSIEINNFINAIASGLTFHPARPWFIALFSPSKKRYRVLTKLISDKKLFYSKKRILDIEHEIRKFMLGKW